jgi:hypothetical protein
MRTQRGVCLTLAAMVLLAGCSQPIMVAQQAVAPVRQASTTLSAETLATRFAANFADDADFKAERRGAVVILRGPEGIELSYDFTRAPQTGKVTIQSGNTRTETTIDSEASAQVAWTVAKVAIRMVYGGVKAYITYTKNHQGSSYNREDLAKAVLYGMLSQGVAGLPGGFLWKRLMPIVWEWIFNEPPISRSSVKEIYQRWSKALPQIEAILREYRQQGGTFN